MNLEIGQHGNYPTKEVRRIPVATQTFTSDGGTNGVFHSGGGTSRVFNNAGGIARVFDSEKEASRVFSNAGRTARVFNSEEGTSRVYNKTGGTARVYNSEEGNSRVVNKAGGTASVFSEEEGTSRVYNIEGGTTRAFTNEGGRMGKTLKADGNNNQQTSMQRNISEVSSVFASGSDFETDYDGSRRSRSEALRSSSTDGRLDGNNWIATENTEVKRQVVKQNHPKGSLFGRWKMLNDEFQNKYIDYSSNSERNQTQVGRISHLDRFDNVRQVFTEGNGITKRVPPEENESKVASYQLTTSKSYSVTEPVVSKPESLERQSETLVVDTSKVKHHKTDRGIIKTSKQDKKLEKEYGAQIKREKQIRALEKKKKKQKHGKTIEKKAAEFVDGLIEDAWAVCIPRRSVSMENLVSSETQERRITKSKKPRLMQAVHYKESNGNEEKTKKMMTSKQMVSSREEWLLENSSTADDRRRRETRHFQDASAEGSSYMGEGTTGVNVRTKSGGYSAEESAAGGMNVRTSVERFSSTAESADDLNVRTRVERSEGQRSRSSNGSSVIDMHRGGIQQDVGHDLTHIIRPIPGSGSYTRMFSHSRHGSGSYNDRRIRLHSEGYASDATPLPSTSREKVRLENAQAISHIVLESSRSLENLNSSSHVRPTLTDESTTFDVSQRCWSYDNLSTDCRFEGSDHTSPSVTKGLMRKRPPTLTKGMITRVFYGCDEKCSPVAEPSQNKQLYSEFQHINQTPFPEHDIRAKPGLSTDYTVFLPIKDTTDAPYLDSRSIAAERGGTHSLEMIPYQSSYGRSQTASSSPIKFHATPGATPDLDSPGTTFSNLPIFVADVLSPMTEDYHSENQSEGFVRRQNTMASTISDDGGGSFGANADVHMTRDQVLNFYVFNQQTPEKSQMQEITRSITLGDERAPTYNRETQTAGNDKELTQKYTVEREAPKEGYRRIQPKGQTETIHYIAHQREIEKLPEAKRSVESTSAQTDLEGFYTTDSEWDSRKVPVQTMGSKISEDRPTETSSFDEYYEEEARFPVVFEERGALPVRVVVAKESTTAAPILAAEKETEEEEEFVETTIVEEKEEKICMEIREEVEFSMLRKQGTLLERGGGMTSVEPWWIPDRYEAVVDRRKIKTTKTEQLHNDEDYSLKRERHHLKDQGSVPTGRTTYQYQVPGVQHQGKSMYAAATGSSSGRVADTKSGVFISGRRGIGVPQRNGMHRNNYFSRQHSSQSPGSLGVFGNALSSSSTAWKTREGKHSQNGGYSTENRSQMTESTGSGEQRIGSSYEPNNVCFGRKSEEMVLRELHDLGDSVGAKTAVQDIARATLSSNAYNGGKVIFSSQSEPVAETKLIRDEDGSLVKVTERKHTMTKTVEYPGVAAEVGLRSSEQMRIFDSSYDEGSFGMNSETSDTNHQGSSSEESDAMKPVKHFETMATPL